VAKKAWGSMRSTHVALSSLSAWCGRNRIAVQRAPRASWQDRPGRKPEVCGDRLASHAGSKAWRTQVCRARSAGWEFPVGALQRWTHVWVSRCVGARGLCHQGASRWPTAIVRAGGGTSPHHCPRCASLGCPGSCDAPPRVEHPMTSRAPSAAGVRFCPLLVAWRGPSAGGGGRHAGGLASTRCLARPPSGMVPALWRVASDSHLSLSRYRPDGSLNQST
jgi:hypothetical protein